MKPTIRRILKEESRTQLAFNKLLNLLFDGFDDMFYDWANYDCGMGICCDPYAVGFTLPNDHHDDYLFKLVDSKNWEPNGDNYPKEISDELPEVCYEQPIITDINFDVIIFSEEGLEEIESYWGDREIWKFYLLDLINKRFGCDAKNIFFMFI